jgi:hypothetical protein
MKKIKKSTWKWVVVLVVGLLLLIGGAFTIWILYPSSNSPSPASSMTPTQELLAIERPTSSVIDNPVSIVTVAGMPTDIRLTATSQSASLDFSPSTINTIPPADILPEITYYGGGGGFCEGTYTQPVIETNFTTRSANLLQKISILSCGWAPNDQVAIKVRQPDGQEKSFTQTVESTFMGDSLWFEYATDLNSPQGTYLFSFSGSNGEASYSIPVSLSPGVFIKEVSGNKGRLMLFGFQPNETVRLFEYQRRPNDFAAMLLGWREYTVDSAGIFETEFEIHTDGNIFVALGTVSSGEASNLLPGQISSVKK